MSDLVPLVAIFAGVGVALTLGWLNQARENRRAVLMRLEPALERGLLQRPSPGLWTDVLEGRRADRPVRIEVSSLASMERHRIEATLDLRHAPPVRLRIRRDAGWAALQKWLGLVEDVEVAQGDRFDRRYLVEVSHHDAGEGPLADRQARERIHTLLTRWRLDEVAIEDGVLRVSGATDLLGRALIHDLLDALEVLAHGYDRRPVIRIDAPDRYAWIGGQDSAARCPYCHDALHSEVDLAACEDCGTLLHGECHAEHGSCPILGCTGRRLERLGPLPL